MRYVELLCVAACCVIFAATCHTMPQYNATCGSQFLLELCFKIPMSNSLLKDFLQCNFQDIRSQTTELFSNGDLNIIVKDEGLLKVTGSHVHWSGNVIISRKQC